MRRTEYTPKVLALKSLYNKRKINEIKFNKKYQRALVWKSKMKEDLIETIFFNMPIGSAIVWDNGIGKEVVDGLQRISTIESFMNNEFSLSPAVSRKIVQSYKNELAFENSKEARLYTRKLEQNINFRLKYSSLPMVLLEYFDTYQFSIIEIAYTSEEEIRNYFVKVQNQEKLKAGEIIRSIPSNMFVDKFNTPELDTIAASIGYDNKRKDMVKFVVMFHGIAQGKLSLNVPDSRIITYAAKENEVNEIFKNRLRMLKNRVVHSSFERKIKTKTELKLFLMGVLLTDKLLDTDMNSYISNIKNLIESTKILNSNDPTNIETMKELRNNYPGVYKVFTLTKGQHSSKIVKDVLPTFTRLMTTVK